MDVPGALAAAFGAGGCPLGAGGCPLGAARLPLGAGGRTLGAGGCRLAAGGLLDVKAALRDIDEAIIACFDHRGPGQAEPGGPAKNFLISIRVKTLPCLRVHRFLGDI